MVNTLTTLGAKINKKTEQMVVIKKELLMPYNEIDLIFSNSSAP